jgi:hypothetical protein
VHIFTDIIRVPYIFYLPKKSAEDKLSIFIHFN